MPDSFASGVMAGEEQKKSNPFNLILGRFQEAQARRYKEDMERKKEEAELQNALQLLGFQHNYDKELAKITAEEEKKNILLREQAGGTITETEETGAGTFEGTPFGMVGKRYKATPVSAPPSQLLSEEGKAPEGYEIVGYDQKGQPMIRKKQPTMGEKASEKARLEAQRNFEIARNKLKVTAGAFKAMIEQEGAGRAGGFARIFTGATGINPYVKPFEGQLVEAAASLAKLAAPSARVGQEIIAQFKKTLPTKYSTWDEFTSQLRFSLHNAFGTALGQANEPYTKEKSDMVDAMVDDLISTEPMTVNKRQQQGNIPSFNSEQEAEAAGLPSGTVVIINGRKARIVD